jgi:hypothetical protein
MRSPNVETSHDNWRAKLFNVKALYRELPKEKERYCAQEKRAAVEADASKKRNRKSIAPNTLKAVY